MSLIKRIREAESEYDNRHGAAAGRVQQVLLAVINEIGVKKTTNWDNVPDEVVISAINKSIATIEAEKKRMLDRELELDKRLDILKHYTTG